MLFWQGFLLCVSVPVLIFNPLPIYILFAPLFHLCSQERKNEGGIQTIILSCKPEIGLPAFKYENPIHTISFNSEELLSQFSPTEAFLMKRVADLTVKQIFLQMECIFAPTLLIVASSDVIQNFLLKFYKMQATDVYKLGAISLQTAHVLHKNKKTGNYERSVIRL